MSLDPASLEKLVEFGGGRERPRCPACREHGADRTLRTSQLSLCVAQENREEEKEVYTLKEFDEGVRCVRVATAPAHQKPRLPYLTADGTLAIPFDSPARYHWWTGGQSPRLTKQ